MGCVGFGGIRRAGILPPMKRTAIIAVWLVSLGAAYLIGRLAERSEISAIGLPAAGERLLAEQVLRERALEGADVALTQEGLEVSSGVPGRSPDLVGQAEALVAEGRLYDAIEILQQYLRDEVHDAVALFLMSDLRQMTGDVELALPPLFAIMRFPPTPELAERARKRLLLLINAREQQLINSGDMAGLVAYFEYLVAAEPSYDGHRLKLVRWLLRSDEVDAAARLLREVGLVGVESHEIDALRHEIDLARSALPIERQGGAMYTRATVVGARRTREFRLLVDTGATMSGMDVSRLESLGAHKIANGVRVQTANGVVALPVYRIRELRIGALSITDMDVLGFSDLPRNADGLLGMDVLGGLSGDGVTPVGRP